MHTNMHGHFYSISIDCFVTYLCIHPSKYNPPRISLYYWDDMETALIPCQSVLL